MLSINAINELCFVFRRRRFVSNNDAVVFDVFFLNFVVRVFEVSRGPFRKFVFGWTSDGEVSRGWFRNSRLHHPHAASSTRKACKIHLFLVGF